MWTFWPQLALITYIILRSSSWEIALFCLENTKHSQEEREKILKKYHQDASPQVKRKASNLHYENIGGFL